MHTEPADQSSCEAVYVQLAYQEIIVYRQMG